MQFSKTTFIKLFVTLGYAFVGYSHRFGRRTCHTIGKLIEQTAHMNGKPPVVNVICFVAEKVEELGIHDCHYEIEGVIGIGNDDEQRRLPVSDGVQLHLIVAHQLPQLCDVEGRKPCTAGN